jgi:hypothetical protein
VLSRVLLRSNLQSQSLEQFHCLLTIYVQSLTAEDEGGMLQRNVVTFRGVYKTQNPE